jgi:hypothetical protein
MESPLIQKPRFSGAFFYIDTDVLYALKSRGFGGEVRHAFDAQANQVAPSSSKVIDAPLIKVISPISNGSTPSKQEILKPYLVDSLLFYGGYIFHR